MNAFYPCILLDELYPILPSAVEKNPPHDLLSKADFVHGVETLVGKLEEPRFANFLTDDLEAVFVACPDDTWKRTFGEPRGIQEHHAIQAWEQPCNDGVVHCVGYFVDDFNDGKWVILTRVCLF
jgi:hypothetical protein